MWRKPPKLIEAAIRALIVLGTLLIGFASVRIMTVGLSFPERLVGIFLSLVVPGASVCLARFNPKLRAERRYAASLSEELPSDGKFTVHLALLKGEAVYGQDTGVLRFEGGCLHFHGLATSFSIPRSQLRLRTDAEGETTHRIALLTRVEEEPIGINFSEPEMKRLHPSLLESFDRFWNSASTGEFVPPPTTRRPRIWSGRFFPGWREVVFWAAVYVFVIVQAQVLHDRNLLSAQRVLVVAFIGTLLTALVMEGLCFKRLMEEVERDLPRILPHLLPEASSTAHATDEPAEVRINA